MAGSDWTPTPHGRFMAEVLARHNLVSGKDVLELGGGIGNHTIVLVRQGAKQIVTTEIAPERSETTRRNVEHNCPDAQNVEYRVADWLDIVGRFDVVVSIPHFAKCGWQNRRYFIDSLILDGELWRAVTALTLHADGAHVAGNAVLGAVFGSAVSRSLGPGVALAWVIAAGTLGNFINAWKHTDSHVSVGASTAVLGAVGSGQVCFTNGLAFPRFR